MVGKVLHTTQIIIEDSLYNLTKRGYGTAMTINDLSVYYGIQQYLRYDLKSVDYWDDTIKVIDIKRL